MKVGFIGCGNMGGALARAAAKALGAGSIFVTDALKGRAEEFARETGANAADISLIAQSCDYIFLGVKPQQMQSMLSEIKDALAARRTRFVLVTMAAGLTIETLRAYAKGGYPIIRIMPNLPASVGEGMVLWCAEGTQDSENEAFEKILSCAGRLLHTEEKLIDAGSAISGCGPAFVCLFIEALADGGVQCGLRRDAALELAVQTVIGTGKLLEKTRMHPAALKDAVCSPGGTTIAGVLALEDGAFRAAAARAVTSAYEKTLKLKG
ncbi:MAG: pyrroline-5-carboxylate reductase [Clostridia bacterium]|nr:pyrroline-5-carboxylate reductase [Clostridia bacterium]